MCALIMCKSKDAVIASYHWAVLHTPVDTRAMYYVSSLLPLFVSRTFRYGRGERQDCEKKDCRGDRVGVFQWLARLARLARWLAHWPHSWRSQRELIILEPWVAFLFLDNSIVKINTLSCFLWLYQSICQAQNNSQSTVIHCTPARMATGLIKNFTEYTLKQAFELNKPMIVLGEFTTVYSKLLNRQKKRP